MSIELRSCNLLPSSFDEKVISFQTGDSVSLLNAKTRWLLQFLTFLQRILYHLIVSIKLNEAKRFSSFSTEDGTNAL